MASAVPDNASVVADQTAVVVEERHAVGGGATPVVAGLAGSSGEPEIEDDANEDVQSVDSNYAHDTEHDRTRYRCKCH